MIEIKAKLLRADSAIYATGERVECLIEFTHKVFQEELAGGSRSRNANDARWVGSDYLGFRLMRFLILAKKIWPGPRHSCIAIGRPATPTPTLIGLLNLRK